METVTHWTENSITDFVYNISSNFVAQIETKIEAEEISQNEIANKMNKSSGRISQLLNNPGNLSIRVMVELARALGMKVSIVAYDDDDSDNNRGPIDPDVFVKCWKRAGRPANLFSVYRPIAATSSKKDVASSTQLVIGITNYGVPSQNTLQADERLLMGGSIATNLGHARETILLGTPAQKATGSEKAA